ncbi:MAG TPA: PIN domain-containing protein [Pirellulales bacterium]|nr:PIN domain-containing protein [Pirellulales bacterium]
MNDVFLDTVGLIATWDRRDQWHAPADAACQQLHQHARRLVTTPLVLWECGNAAARCPYRPRVNVLRRFLIQEGLLIQPTLQETEAAWSAYDRGEAAEAGIVDHVSFVVMRRLGITEAFTNDRHFQAAGFTTLF